MLYSQGSTSISGLIFRHSSETIATPCAQLRTQSLRSILPSPAGAEEAAVKESFGQQDVPSDLGKFGDNVANQLAEPGFILRLACVEINDRAVKVDAVSRSPADQIVYALGILLLHAIPVRRRSIRAVRIHVNGRVYGVEAVTRQQTPGNGRATPPNPVRKASCAPCISCAVWCRENAAGTAPRAGSSVRSRS